MMISYYSDSIIIGLALFIQGTVSLVEAAFLGVKKERIHALVESGDARAHVLNRIIDSRHALLTTLMILINVCLLTVSGVTTRLVYQVFGPQAEHWTTWISLGMVLIMLTLFEVAPKALAQRHTERLALVFARPVSALIWFFNPLVRGLTVLSKGIIRRAFVPVFGGQVEPVYTAYTEEEIRQLLAVGEQIGELEAEERDMLDAAIEFADKVAREVMVPRTDMICLEETALIPEAVQVGVQSGYSRIPVCRGDLDHIVGILFIRDLVPLLAEGRLDIRVSALMRPAYFVPESKKIDELLRDMQGRRAHMAIIIDEYGGVSGLVTIEDILEEIVGEIRDEFDVAEEEPIRMVDENTAVVLGRASPDDVAQTFDTHLPEGDFDTIGGFVIDRLGRLPEVGDTVEYGSLILTVEEVSEQRVQRVRIVRREEPQLDEERQEE